VVALPAATSADRSNEPTHLAAALLPHDDVDISAAAAAVDAGLM